MNARYADVGNYAGLAPQHAAGYVRLFRNGQVGCARCDNDHLALLPHLGASGQGQGTPQLVILGIWT